MSQKVLELGWDVLEKLKEALPRIERPDIVVGILRGGAAPAVLASHYFDVPVKWYTSKSYENRTKSQLVEFEPLDLTQEDVLGRKVLLIDDVLETGETMLAVGEHLQSLSGTEPIRLVLVQKKLENIDVPVFSLLAIDPAIWVVFPWEAT